MRIVRDEKNYKNIHEIIDNLIIDSINVVREMYEDILKTNGHKNTDIFVCLIDTEYISKNIYRTPINFNMLVEGYLIENSWPNKFTESLQAREGSIWNVVFNNILNDSYNYTPNIKYLFADPSFKETLRKNNLMGLVMYPIFSTDGEMFGFIFQPIYNIYTYSFKFMKPELFDHVPY